MDFFEVRESEIYFRNEGELLKIEGWGENSLRVQSSLMDQIPSGESALLPQEERDVKIQVEDMRHASIQNGSIRAELFVQEWGNALQITFRDETGKVLLREISGGGALTRKARFFQALPGGGYRLNRAPDQYTVADILYVTEGSMAPVACLEPGAKTCDRAAYCRTLDMWKRLYELITQFFSGITIADLIADKSGGDFVI